MQLNDSQSFLGQTGVSGVSGTSIHFTGRPTFPYGVDGFFTAISTVHVASLPCTESLSFSESSAVSQSASDATSTSSTTVSLNLLNDESALASDGVAGFQADIQPSESVGAVEIASLVIGTSDAASAGDSGT